MNGKKAKKIRREVKRHIKYTIGEGAEALSTLVRPRPRFIPKCVWVLFYIPLFKRKYLGIIYKHMK